MSFAENPYRSTTFSVAAEAEADERAAFIAKTYAHLAVAIAAFIALTAGLLQLPGIGNVAATMVNGYNWLLVLGAFMVVSWIADRWAMSDTSRGMQYLGLTVYVAAQAVIFVPILYMAQMIDPSIIPTAGLGTIILFGGLTLVVFVTRADFSFLRSALMFAGFAALGLIVCSILFGFTLGSIFTVAMIAFACCYILYYTSNVLHVYRTDQYVAASLAIFASVALLFWYVLRLVMAARN